jgi:hypothetical protein
MNKELHPKTRKCVNKCNPGKSRNKDFRCTKTKSTTAKKTLSPEPNTAKKTPSPAAKKKAGDIDCEKINKELHPKTRKCVNKCNPGKTRNADFRCTATKNAKPKPGNIFVFPKPAVYDSTVTIKDTTDMLNLINHYTSEGEKYQEEGIKYYNNPVLLNLLQFYLIEKYGSASCFIRTGLAGNYYNYYSYTTAGLVLIGGEDKPYRQKFYKERFYKQIKLILKCMERIKFTNEEVIIIPLQLYYVGEVSSHQNMLIYRKSLGVIEHFEPHGRSFNGYNKTAHNYYNTQVPIILETIVNKMNTINNESGHTYYKNNLVYVPPSDVCPYISGFQSIEGMVVVSDNIIKKEGGGFCLLWSFFWAEMVLLNPHIPTNDLYKLVIQAMHTSTKNKTTKYIPLILRNIIRGYLQVMYVQVKHIIENIPTVDSFGNPVVDMFGNILDMTTLISEPRGGIAEFYFNEYLDAQFKKYNDVSWLEYQNKPASKSFSSLQL